MDNKLFNINGGGEELLLKVLELAFAQEGRRLSTCSGWRQTKENGLILCWTTNPPKINAMPADLTAVQCMPFVTEWLKGEFAKTVSLGVGCNDEPHDGHNTLGWQVYCEGWGHVGDEHYAICAVRPAFLWHGK